MKRNIIKLLSAFTIGIGIFSTCKIAYADDLSWALNNALNKEELSQRLKGNSDSSSLIDYISNPITVYADSSQWDYREPYWVLATPDFHQSYTNAWANVNGTWYYIGTDGNMVFNHIIQDLTTNKKYYVNKDGSLLVNGYYTDYYNNETPKYYAGSDGALTLVNNSNKTYTTQEIPIATPASTEKITNYNDTSTDVNTSSNGDSSGPLKNDSDTDYSSDRSTVE